MHDWYNASPKVKVYRHRPQSEVTVREVLFSVLLAGFLLAIGFWISSAIQHKVNQRLLRYRQAAQIENNDDEFKLALFTDIGDAFVQGTFNAVGNVTHESLPGAWTSIDATYQKYTKHTRVVTYTVTDGKGRSHTRTRTETYWTWDNYKYESVHVKEVEFCGVRFQYDKFDYSWRCHEAKTVNTAPHYRICFDYVPTNFNASCYTTLMDGTITKGTTLHKGMSIGQLYESSTTSHVVLIFWIVWGMLTAIVLAVFVLQENDWLEG